MPTLASIIDLVHPAADASSIITTDTIWVLFDQEVDEDTVKASLFVEGPDTDTVLGPDFSLSLPQTSYASSGDLLASPGMRGLVAGTITFERIQNANLNTYSGWDYTGTGTSFRLKATFTPSQRLAINTVYRVYLVGDEDSSDDLRTGIKSRSIFDTVKGANLGTGEAEFRGSYDGTASTDTFRVTITKLGTAGVAEFEWYRDSNPIAIHGPIRSLADEGTLLEDGVSIRFSTGSFSVDDTFSVVVVKPSIFTGNVTWEFETGSGSITTLPITTSTTVIGDVGSPTSAATAAGTFVLSKATPEDKATSQPITTNQIILEFNGTIDASTVTSERVKVFGYPVNGDETLLATREIFKNLTVDGKKIVIDF